MGSSKQKNPKRGRDPPSKEISSTPNKKEKNHTSKGKPKKSLPHVPSKDKNPNPKRIKIDTQTPSLKITTKDSTFTENKVEPEARLDGACFRTINKKLYTCTGKEAYEYFQDDPTLFDLYYAGYQEKMLQWPEKPVDIMIKWVKGNSPALVVADFGCGDAHLAKSVKNKVFSFDLVSKDPSVIECDMSSAPLISSSIDVAVFSLSLMGTDFPGYLREAERVLKPSGWLLIAEVKSRFDPSSGGTDPDRFLKAVCELGFISISKDFSNKKFVLFFFQKKEKKSSVQKEIEWPQLKPCLFKRR
ncbi:25S rRNA (adenine(645)-N(1))-methyltransferase [Ranunculus cassubicifolius]